MSIQPDLDGLVVGAGPAGLAAGAALRASGRSFLVVDRGEDNESRRHDHADELGEGVGGAGLFSDGKFSFYPSGTHLYSLSDQSRLRRAYDWCCAQLNSVGIGSAEFPDVRAHGFQFDGEAVKEYPSFYGTLPARRGLIAKLRDHVGGQIVTRAAVIGIERASDVAGFHVRLARGAETWSTTASEVIFAMGRLGPLQEKLRASRLLRLRPLRYELGIRVEAPHERTFLARHKAADVKRLARVRGFEFRTFCTCRRGEVWNIPYGEYAAISGRSDGPPTAYSNFGFLVRFEGEQLATGRAAWEHVQALLRGRRTAMYQPLREFLGKPTESVSLDDRPWFPRHVFEPGDVHGSLGPLLGPLLREGLQGLLEWSPELDDPRTMCLFPVVEGVGEFPDTNGDLEISEGLRCAGDLVGRIRGIVPSLVSGYYAGLASGRDARGA
ncbi:MAG: NAD(P)-binding protein [Kofleriaceae bacterium]